LEGNGIWYLAKTLLMMGRAILNPLFINNLRERALSLPMVSEMTVTESMLI